MSNLIKNSLKKALGRLKMIKKFRKDLMFHIESTRQEYEAIKNNPAFSWEQVKDAKKDLKALIRVYNYYSNPEDHISEEV